MEISTNAVHSQAVFLKANPTVPIFQSERNWTISHVDRNLRSLDPREHAHYIQTLSDRIVTVPMLQHSFTRHTVAVLLMIWVFVHFRRNSSPPSKRHWILTFACLPMVLLIAWMDQLWFSIIELVLVSVWSGRPWDALATLVVLTLGQQGWMITTIGLTTAYLTWWVVIVSPKKLRQLPTFPVFLASLCPSPYGGRCSICSSSRETALQLPCHVKHWVCKNCLVQFHAAQRFGCPICSKALYWFPPNLSLFRLLISIGMFTSLAFYGAVMLLQMYKATKVDFQDTIRRLCGVAIYFAGTMLLIVYYVFLQICLRRVGSQPLLADLRSWTLWYIFLSVAYCNWQAVNLFRTWDTVTLRDGVELIGVEVWDVLRVPYHPGA
jgi:hypothetical protein